MAQWRNPGRMESVPDLSIEITVTDWQGNVTLGEDVFMPSLPEHARVVILSGWAMKAEASAVRKEAPDFTVHLLDGSERLLSSHEGKDIVIVDFWSIRCHIPAGWGCRF